MQRQYVFDGSWQGLLTAVFEYFERKEKHVMLVHKNCFQPSMFGNAFTVITIDMKAARVCKGLQKKLAKDHLQHLYYTFLSELSECYDALFQVMVKVFRGQENILDNYGDDTALFISQTTKKVSRERHRMKAFIRFEKSTDGLFFAVVEPDFNVLPLIIKFFKNRYADQAWLIYDVKRKYGIYYDRSCVSEVTMNAYPLATNYTQLSQTAYDAEEKNTNSFGRIILKVPTS